MNELKTTRRTRRSWGIVAAMAIAVAFIMILPTASATMVYWSAMSEETGYQVLVDNSAGSVTWTTYPTVTDDQVYYHVSANAQGYFGGNELGEAEAYCFAGYSKIITIPADGSGYYNFRVSYLIHDLDREKTTGWNGETHADVGIRFNIVDMTTGTSVTGGNINNPIASWDLQDYSYIDEHRGLSLIGGRSYNVWMWMDGHVYALAGLMSASYAEIDMHYEMNYLSYYKQS